MYLEQDNLVNKEVFESITDIATCSICTGIVFQPLQCNKCENCFCKSCIAIWKQKDTLCPFKCSDSEFKDPSRIIKNMLSKLIFNCPFNCDKKINYDDLALHESKCVSETVKCPTCNTIVPKNSIDKKSIEEMSIRLEILTKQFEEKDEEMKQIKSENNQLRIENEKLKELKVNTRDEIRQSIQDFYSNNHNGLNTQKNMSTFEKNYSDSMINKYHSHSHNINNQMMNNLSIHNNSNMSSTPNDNSLLNQSSLKDLRDKYSKKDILKSNYDKKDLNNEVYDPDTFKYTIYIDNCSHNESNYVPIFSCCDKAFPCVECHDLKVEQFHIPRMEYVYCKMCLTINDYKNIACMGCETKFTTKDINSSHKVNQKQKKKHINLIKQPELKKKISFDVYENERWWIMVGWSKNLVMEEVPLWGDLYNSPLQLGDVVLPDNYKWSGEWSVFKDFSTDSEGWTYAVDFESPFDKQEASGLYVRRRRWVRSALLM